ncbi:FxDxF family PEP-CTERM protein [Roseateles chitinivorans]|uniref:FxDxF family PEP-CTERM protein n=1 Tax=Roseateles chitinivorans TaxID=2917965 RepID=UPI003D67731E
MSALPAIALAAAVLGLIGTPAAADPVDLSSGTGGFIGTPGAGGFSESYTFSLVSPTTVNILLASVANGDHRIDFSSIVLNGPSGPINATAFSPDPFSGHVISNAALAPGSYTLTASGTNSAAPATFVGTIALAGSSSASPSGNGGPLDLSAGSAGFVSTPNAGAFSNVFTFSIVHPQAVKLMLSSAVGGSQDIDFTSVLLRGPFGDLMAAEFTRDPFEIWTLATPLLSPGSYSIIASGINSDAIATYAGTLALSPVDPDGPGNNLPEPGTGALVIAGLGAAFMRLTARSRRARRL